MGLEADFQGALEKDSATLTNPFSFTFFPIPNDPAVHVPVTGSAVTNYSAQIDWFGTVRLRAGYVWGEGTVFSYVTGGLAYGEVKTDGITTVSGTVTGNTFSITHALGHSQVNTGWTLGYGTEGKLLVPGWTWKVESLYMDLGTLDDTDKIVVTPKTVSGGKFTRTPISPTGSFAAV